MAWRSDCRGIIAGVAFAALAVAVPFRADAEPCGLSAPIRLAQLPFAAPSAPGHFGLALVDDSVEGQSSEDTQIDLRVTRFDRVNGGFSGTVSGPVAQTEARNRPVTGIILHNQGNDFAVAFRFTARDRATGQDAIWMFRGTLRTWVLPGTPGRPCSLELQIQGAMTAAGPAITRGPVFGPSPFSGVGIVLAAR